MSRSRIALLVGLVLAAPLPGTGVPAQAAAAPTVLAAMFGGPWTLTMPDGTEVTERTWRGQVVVLYFGYRFCPDICPTELQKIASALDQLGPEAARVQPLFVTIDPARDTPAKLADYTALFHPRLIGLTGTPDQIAAITRAYRVAYQRVEARPGDPDYVMDHSTVVYLIDPGGTTAAVLAPGSTAETIAAAIHELLK